MRQANSSEILQGLLVALTDSVEAFPWEPVYDGPDGLLPDLPSRLLKEGKFARLPFIAGTVLDEGLEESWLFSRTIDPRQVPYSFLRPPAPPRKSGMT